MSEKPDESENSVPEHGAGETLHALALELGLTRPRPGDFEQTDETVRTEVCERLASERDVDLRAVTVAVAAGVVRLHGTVPHRRIQQRIEEVCRTCAGVKAVENAIEVEPAPNAFTERSVPE
jgi:osmotically-inducible protein OsmY